VAKIDITHEPSHLVQFRGVLEGGSTEYGVHGDQSKARIASHWGQNRFPLIQKEKRETDRSECQRDYLIGSPKGDSDHPTEFSRALGG
jgi:hypothetical protein